MNNTATFRNIEAALKKGDTVFFTDLELALAYEVRAMMRRHQELLVKIQKSVQGK